MTPEKLKLEKKKVLHKKYVKSAPFSGLRFFRRSRDKYPRYIIISCHYPWTICWSWFVDITFHTPKFSRYCWKSYIRRNHQGRAVQVGIRLGFCSICYHSQPADYHMKDEYFYEGQKQ